MHFLFICAASSSASNIEGNDTVWSRTWIAHWFLGAWLNYPFTLIWSFAGCASYGTFNVSCACVLITHRGGIYNCVRQNARATKSEDVIWSILLNISFCFMALVCAFCQREPDESKKAGDLLIWSRTVIVKTAHEEKMKQLVFLCKNVWHRWKSARFLSRWVYSQFCGCNSKWLGVWKSTMEDVCVLNLWFPAGMSCVLIC